MIEYDVILTFRGKRRALITADNELDMMQQASQMGCDRVDLDGIEILETIEEEEEYEPPCQQG